MAFAKKDVFVVCCDVTLGLKDEQYRVRILRCPESGVIAEERWETPAGRLHRLEGPALLERDRKTGKVLGSYHCVHGLPHRSDGAPSTEEFDEVTGTCVYRAYRVEGVFSRPDDLPHAEWIDPSSGVVYRAEYYASLEIASKPLLHRESGPALVTFDRETGEQTGYAYYKHGQAYSYQNEVGLLDPK